MLSAVNWFQKLNHYFASKQEYFLLAAAFCIPIKLSISYCFIVPLIIFTLANAKEHSFFKDQGFLGILSFFVFALFISLFGLNPLRSAIKLFSPILFSCTIVVFANAAHRGLAKKILLSLLSGQALAALHSVLEGAFPDIFGKGYGKFFLGKVTESGQLAMTCVIIASIVFASREKIFSTGFLNNPIKLTGDLSKKSPLFAIIFLAVATSLYSALAFSARLGLSQGVFLLLVILFLIFSLFHVSKQALILPLLFSALLINLKRGPWSGVTIGLAILLAQKKPKVILPFFALISLLAVSIAPVRERLFASSTDFFISGGRSAIWNVGVDIALRYPLGVGYKNSAFLREFSPAIPKELTHFHNNFLNILVEVGVVGLVIYLAWIILLLKKSFSAGENAGLKFAIGAALISWQVAGIVEYNFGDSEVLLLAYVLIGLLVGLGAVKNLAPNR